MGKNTRRVCQNCKKWQNSADAQDFRKRSENHQDKQQPELTTTARADVLPEAG